MPLWIPPAPVEEAPPTGTSTLLDDLISYWKLDEASGNAVDAHGTNHLTDVNTVTSAPGKVGTAREFVRANAERLSIASNSSLRTGDIDFTLACWVKFTAFIGTYTGIIGQFDIASDRSYLIDHDTGANRLSFLITVDGATPISVNDTHPVLLNEWYFVVGWHDSVLNTINIQVDNETLVSVAHSGGVRSSLTSAFVLGDFQSSQYSDAIIDEAAFWKRVLTADERTALFNGGAGTTYPFSGSSGGGGEEGPIYDGDKEITGDLEVGDDLTVVGELLLADGTAAIPSLAFLADPDTGMFRHSDGRMSWAVDGTMRMQIGALTGAGLVMTNVPNDVAGLSSFAIAGSGDAYGKVAFGLDAGIPYFGFGSGAASRDTFLYREAAGTFSQRNGTNRQVFGIYNTYTDAGNYERLLMGWNPTGFSYVINDVAGTGVLRPLLLGGSKIRFHIPFVGDAWEMNGGGGNYDLLPGADGVADLGNATRRLRHAFLSGNITSWAGNVTLYNGGNPEEYGVLAWNTNTLSFLPFATGAGIMRPFRLGGSTIYFHIPNVGDAWEMTNARHLLPSVDNTMDIGDATHRVRNLYVAGSIVGAGGGGGEGPTYTGNKTITGTLDVGGLLTVDDHIHPLVDNTYDIGDGTHRVRDLYVGQNVGVGNNIGVSGLVQSGTLQVGTAPTTGPLLWTGLGGFMGIGTTTQYVGAGSILNIRGMDVAGYMSFVSDTVICFLGALNNDTGPTASSGFVGTFSNHPFAFRTNNVTRWYFDISGHFVPYTDASYDLGNATHQIRTLYLGNGSVLGSTAQLLAASNNGDYGLTIRNLVSGTGSSGYVQVDVNATQQAGLIVYGASHSTRPNTAWIYSNVNVTDLVFAAQAAVSTITFRVGGTTTTEDRWKIPNTGHFLPVADNAYDIGDATHRVRNLYLAGSPSYSALTVTGTTTNGHLTVTSDTVTTEFGALNNDPSYTSGGYVGTTTNHRLFFRTNGITRWLIGITAGAFFPNLDNTYDIGAGSNRLKDLYVGGFINSDGYHQFKEIAAPSAAEPNGVRVYARDNGSGKTQLVALFQTGAVQVLSTEP